jgi:GH24 family phage-related lysozyme (muramidase)
MMTVELGSAGYYTRAVQRIIGVPASKVDGKCGPFSVAIMETWQARHGVDPDGVFGPVSRAAVDPLNFIQAYEGLVLQAYDDYPGPLSARLLTWNGGRWVRADGGGLRRYATIGWGTRIWPGQELARQRCTRAQADQWLRDFVVHILQDAIVRYVPRERMVDAAQEAAIKSLGYNGGPGAIRDLAAANFDPRWWSTNYVKSNGVYAPGLGMRRREEAALYAGDDSWFDLSSAA